MAFTPPLFEPLASRKIISMIEGCKAFDMGYRGWCARRRFIADEIKTTGTFLDIGCGSGFLIACLMVWSRLKLQGFGLDLDVAAVELARAYFASRTYAFVVADVQSFDFRPVGWPESFDYVFWNVPNNWIPQRCVQVIRRAWHHVGDNGRLILAQYGEGGTELDAAQRRTKQEKMSNRWIELERSCNIPIDHIRWNSMSNLQSIAVSIRKGEFGNR